MKDSGKQPQRRAFYRLRYPEGDGLLLKIDADEYQVVEISEGGARILPGPKETLAVGSSFHGLLQFRDGSTVPVAGVLLRKDDQEGAIQFSQGVKFGKIQAEQRRLLRQYPTWFRE